MTDTGRERKHLVKTGRKTMADIGRQWLIWEQTMFDIGRDICSKLAGKQWSTL